MFLDFFGVEDQDVSKCLSSCPEKVQSVLQTREVPGTGCSMNFLHPDGLKHGLNGPALHVFKGHHQRKVLLNVLLHRDPRLCGLSL